MSGPNAESASLHVRVSADLAYWPLELWSDADQAALECNRCGSGEIARARDGFRGKLLTLVDLIAALEAHAPKCHAVDRNDGSPL